MNRRRIAAWLLSLPLMVAGSQVAHALAYQWVYPQARVRLSALLSTGHGYLLGAAGIYRCCSGCSAPSSSLRSAGC